MEGPCSAGRNTQHTKNTTMAVCRSTFPLYSVEPAPRQRAAMELLSLLNKRDWIILLESLAESSGQKALERPIAFFLSFSFEVFYTNSCLEEICTSCACVTVDVVNQETFEMHNLGY